MFSHEHFGEEQKDILELSADQIGHIQTFKFKIHQYCLKNIHLPKTCFICHVVVQTRIQTKPAADSECCEHDV